MAESTLSHLNYGHAGAATFDIDSRSWNFGRQFSTTTLKQIGVRDYLSTDTVPASIQFPNTAVSTRITDAYEHVKSLTKRHAHLLPATDLLPELAVTSAAVVSTTSTYDPLVGSLYSTGSVTQQTRSDRWDNPRRVAAMVAGEAGNLLRLSLFQKEHMGWGKDERVRIRGETLRDAENGYWNEEAAPIQQVCFAQSEDRSALLAVRLPTKTVIFRPFYTQRVKTAPRSPHYSLPPSVLDAHPILRLDTEQTGGSPHVDITFNPDFQLQFAVVDQNQVWSVWDIDHGRKGDHYKLSCLVQGPVTPLEEADQIADDGWARIRWVGDVNTIVVCNRRHLSIIDITGGSITHLPSPILFSQRSDEWILDVKTHPLLKSRFLVLTSSSLFLVAVTTSAEGSHPTAGTEGAHVLLSWRHYRGSEDFTLGLSVGKLDEDGLCVLLHSRINNLTQTYTFSNLSSDSAAMTSGSDPTLLGLAVDGMGQTLQVMMEPCPFEAFVPSNIRSSGQAYLARGLSFYKLFILQSDLSIHETIVYTQNSVDIKDSVEDILWTKFDQRRKAVRTKVGAGEFDDFLDLSGIHRTELPVSKLPLQLPTRFERTTMNTVHRVSDYRLIYDALTRVRLAGEATMASTDIPNVTAQLSQLLAASSELSQLPLGTLAEIAGMSIEVSDVDEASSSLQELFDTTDQDGAVCIRHIAPIRLLHLGEDENTTISELYDVILQSWLAPMPSNAPLRVRQHKERLARRIAAEVTMAATRCQLHYPAAESQLGLSQINSLAVPILSSQPLLDSPSKSSQWASSQPLPSPPLTQRSLSEPQSSPQPSPPDALGSADPLVRLSKHLKFKEDSILHTSIPASVEQLLSHWQPGTDPRSYEWDAAERANRTDSLDESSQKMLEKARKRKERREKKQQRENELMRTQSSSQPFTFMKPTAFSRSSPGPMLGGIGSSSQASSQPFTQVPLPGTGFQSSQPGFNPFAVQSQVGPGKYGGRLDKKKKKKNRVSGF